MVSSFLLLTPKIKRQTPLAGACGNLNENVPFRLPKCWCCLGKFLGGVVLLNEVHEVCLGVGFEISEFVFLFSFFCF